MRKIGVFGASGRMGKTVISLLEGEYSDRAQVSARVDASHGSLEEFSTVDAVIDFTLPEATERLTQWMSAHDGPLPALVSGTTGLSPEQHAGLMALAESTKVFHASNFSAGTAAMAAILEFAAPILRQLELTPVLSEVHHRHKQDVPSGTAKTLCDVIDAAYGSATETHSVRAGEVIGQHGVVFYGNSEQIGFSHEAQDRDLFARGAIDATLWLCDDPGSTGGYTMASYFTKRFLG